MSLGGLPPALIGAVDDWLTKQKPQIGAVQPTPPQPTPVQPHIGAAPPTAAPQQPSPRPAGPMGGSGMLPGGTEQVGAPVQQAAPAGTPQIGAPVTPDYAKEYGDWAATRPPDLSPDAGKPSMIRKIGGIALGTAIGALNPKGGAEVGESIINAPRHGLELEQQQKEQAWERQGATIKAEAGLADTGSQIEQRQSQSARDRAEAAKDARAPEVKEPKTAESGGQAFQFNDQTGRYDIPIGTPKTPTVPEEEKAISDYLGGKSLPDTPANRTQARIALKQSEQLPQRPERTLMEVPQADGSSKIIEATPGMTIPKGAKPASKIGGDDKATADETRRADLASNMNENLNQLEDILTRRPDLFGWFSGRETELKGTIGTSDPDVAALKTIKEQMGMAMVGAHAMRNAQHVEAAANSIVNGYHNSPDAIKNAISKARSSLQTFIDDRAAGGGGKNTSTSSTAKPTGKPQGQWNPQTGRYE